MDNILLLIVCLLLGLLFGRLKLFPENTPAALNQFVIYISLPALALIYIPQIELESTLLFPVMTSWIVLFLSMLLIPAAGKVFKWDRKTTGCLLLTAGFGNTSFVGLPVIEALYGPEALQIALMVDLPGSFVAITTIGVVIAAVYSADELKKGELGRRILFFPPFITFIAALLMKLTGIRAEGAALAVLERLGSTIIPLALVSVGMQLKIDMQGQSLKPVLVGLGYKLLLAPAFLFFLYVLVLGGRGLMVEISIMEAAMAPMIAGSILAITHGLQPGLATLMVGIGVPLSFITLAFWYSILNFLM